MTDKKHNKYRKPRGKPQRRDQRSNPRTNSRPNSRKGPRSGQRSTPSSSPHSEALDIFMAEVRALDENGHLLATPAEADKFTHPPTIIISGPKDDLGRVGIGDTVLIKAKPIGLNIMEATLIRKAEAPEEPKRVMAILRRDGDQWQLKSTHRSDRQTYRVKDTSGLSLQDGDFVMAEVLSGGRQSRHAPKSVKIVEKLGSIDHPKSLGLLAIEKHDIPFEFSKAALDQAEKLSPPTKLQDGREDIRTLPLITIDGEDARDFDDAVWAGPDPDNPKGWRLVVAIADVSYYVRPDDALDSTAYERGNSVYFPDRVVPMLPERLSNDLCSLRPNEDRACFAVEIFLDEKGQKLRHRFFRALMHSYARVTYNEAQACIEGGFKDKKISKFVKPLYDAFQLLLKQREKRGVLELSSTEKYFVFDKAGNLKAIEPRTQAESNKLIEEFMILANVCAAETLQEKKLPCLYRVHDEPSDEKISELREFLAASGYKLNPGRVTPANFNQILTRAKDSPDHAMIQQVVLRSQSQATYSPNNIGHFGLNLSRYAHFTSPIRRYADLLVHRALVTAVGGSEGALPQPDKGEKLAWVTAYEEIGEHLSVTERRAAAAEWETQDRYVASFLMDRIGADFGGRISGVTEFGLFVTLDETSADGFVPMKRLSGDYFVFDKKNKKLRGQRTKQEYQVGDTVTVTLREASPISGSLVFEMVSDTPAGKGRKPKYNKGKSRAHGDNTGKKPLPRKGKDGKKPAGKAFKPKSGNKGSGKSRRKSTGKA